MGHCEIGGGTGPTRCSAQIPKKRRKRIASSVEKDRKMGRRRGDRASLGKNLDAAEVEVAVIILIRALPVLEIVQY